MQFCKAQVRAVKLKPTDWESVFGSTKEEFCRPRSASPLLERRTKALLDVAPVAAHGLQVRCSVSRSRGGGRHAPLPRQASRGFSSPRHHTSMLLIVISALSNTSTLTATSESGWTQAKKSDSTSASTRTLTMATQ